MRFKLIGLICLIMQCNLSCTQHIINKETVQTLDLHRYMGKWFEIARFDHRFEHNLVGATVEYSFLPNGDIEVVNSGYWGNFSGSFKRAKGIAKITDPTCPSKLNKSRKTKSDGREKRKAIFEAKTKCAQKSRLLPPSGQNTSVVQTPFESCLKDAFLLNFLLKYHLKTHCQFSKKSYLYIVVMLPLCIPSRPHS